MIQNKQTMKLHEALNAGYEKYLYADEGFQSLRDLQFITDIEITDRNCELVDPNGFNPAGISKEDIADMLADHVQSNQDFVDDDTDNIYDAIKALEPNFGAISDMIDEALSKVVYYKSSGIKIVMD